MWQGSASNVSQALFQALVEQSLVGVYLFQGDRFLYVNQALAELFGYQPEEIVGKLGPLDLTHPKDRALVQNEIRRRLSGEVESVRHQFRGLRRDGSMVWCETFGQRVEYQGQPMIVGTLVDITQRKEMEEALEARELYYRVFFEGAKDAIFIMEDDRFIECNGDTLRMFGCDEKGEIVGQTPYRFSPPLQPDGRPSKEKAIEFIKAALDGTPQRFYWRHIRKDGEPFDADVSLNRVDIGEKVYLQAIVRNITRQKKVEEALRKSEELYRDLVEKAGLAIFVLDTQGRIVYFNRRLCELSGFDPEELHGFAFMDGVHPDDRKGVLGFFRRWFSRDPSAPVQYECRLLRKNGEIRYVEVNVTPVVEKGQVTGSRVYLRDNTERRQMEEQLLLSRKMEAIGRLAGGVAHDFNNMLMVILGSCDLVLCGMDGSSPMYEKVEVIREAAERASSLTRQLLAFSRRQILEPKVVDLNDIVINTEKMLRRLIGEDIELNVVLDPGLGRVKADPSQMEQVIVNLALNARDAMPQGGCLTIEITNAELDDEYARGHVSVVPGAYVMLAVSDTGPGMDEETKAKVFEPFFTTKEKGTGLGLATVYGIVKQSGGNIWCYSEPGKGTTFKIYLPQVEEEVAESSVEPGELAVLEGGAETLLVTEDDDAVREIAVSILRSAGYKVLEAANGDEALEVYKRYGGPVDLLITDVVMPGMSGRKLAERLGAMCPGIKVLYMSGYTDNIIAHHGVLDEGMKFIQKPFSRSDLLKRVRRVLSG